MTTIAPGPWTPPVQPPSTNSLKDAAKPIETLKKALDAAKPDELHNQEVLGHLADFNKSVPSFEWVVRSIMNQQEGRHFPFPIRPIPEPISMVGVRGSGAIPEPAIGMPAPPWIGGNIPGLRQYDNIKGLLNSARAADQEISSLRSQVEYADKDKKFSSKEIGNLRGFIKGVETALSDLPKILEARQAYIDDNTKKAPGQVFNEAMQKANNPANDPGPFGRNIKFGKAEAKKFLGLVLAENLNQADTQEVFRQAFHSAKSSWGALVLTEAAANEFAKAAEKAGLDLDWSQAVNADKDHPIVALYAVAINDAITNESDLDALRALRDTASAAVEEVGPDFRANGAAPLAAGLALTAEAASFSSGGPEAGALVDTIQSALPALEARIADLETQQS